MWFFSPQIVKIITNITLIGLGFLSVPGSTFAFNLNARGFFTKKVDASDQFIRNLNLQADCIVDTTAGAVTFYTEHAFSAIEKLTGLSTQNQLYRYALWQKQQFGNGWVRTWVIKRDKRFCHGDSVSACLSG